MNSAVIVGALYEMLLCREGDRLGVAEKVSRLDAGDASVADIVQEIVRSEEFAARLPEFLRSHGQVDALRFTNDVSQYGEVFELFKLIMSDAGHPGIVVDVGARGRDRSNSYDLLRHFGWSGILVEANPALVQQIERDFADLDIKLICCAVSDYTGTATLTLGVNPDVSSLTADKALDWGPSPGAVHVEVRRLGDLLEENRIARDFGLLSLDIEGEDIKVFNDLVANSSFRPRYVIIEASDDFQVATLDDAPFSKAVKSAYALRARTRANLILSRRP